MKNKKTKDLKKVEVAYTSYVLKNKKGITLIALVITIIVLLILAGITINMLTGKNSILTRAGEAKEKTDVAQIQEEIKIEWNGVQTKGIPYGWTLSEKAEDLQKELRKKDPSATATPNENEKKIDVVYKKQQEVIYDNGSISKNETSGKNEETRTPGLYNAANNQLILSYEDLIDTDKMTKFEEDNNIEAGCDVEEDGTFNGMYYDDPDIKIYAILPDGITSILNLYQGTNTVGVYIPKSVTEIELELFDYYKTLEWIKVDSQNSKYDSRNNCNAIIETSSNTLLRGIKNSIIPNDVTSIGSNAFHGVDITSIHLPTSLKSIGDSAFSESKLSSIQLPASLESIGSGAFMVTNLETIVIPSNVRTIGNFVFGYCQKLGNIYVRGYEEKPADWNENWDNSSPDAKYNVIWKYTGE